jgi:hypothetical protein
MAGEALNVFISYSHRDEGLKDELVNYHLKLLQRDGKINTWQNRNIEVGAEWAEEILMTFIDYQNRLVRLTPERLAHILERPEMANLFIITAYFTDKLKQGEQLWPSQ